MYIYLTKLKNTIMKTPRETLSETNNWLFDPSSRGNKDVRTLLNDIHDAAEQVKKIEDAVWALNDSLTKIHKNDPMAITDRDLNRMHMAQTLLKQLGIRK